MNDHDAVALGIRNAFVITKLSVKNDIAFIGTVGVDTGKHVHKRGFTCTVFPYQRMNLTLLNREIHSA